MKILEREIVFHGAAYLITFQDVRADPSWRPVQAVERWYRNGALSSHINHTDYDKALDKFNNR